MNSIEDLIKACEAGGIEKVKNELDSIQGILKLAKEVIVYGRSEDMRDYLIGCIDVYIGEKE